MVTKHAVAPTGAKKPHTIKSKATREPRSAIAELDTDERRAFEEWKREKERNQEAWEHKTEEELELKFLKKLNDKDKKGSKKDKEHSFGREDACGDQQPKIDLETLAEKVFFRLIVEARIERERTGWAG